MIKRLLLVTLAGLSLGASWKISEQSSTRIVLESVADTPTPTPPPSPPPTDNSSQWIMAYYVGYQQSLYPPEKVDFKNLTHLMVGRVVPRSDGTLNTTLDIDATQGPALAKKLSGLAHANGKKAILMLGGDGARAGFVGAASSTNRKVFISNLLKVADDFGYDGFDLDWEPIQPTDKPLLLALAKELKAARPSLLLTIPVGWINANFSADSWYANLVPYLDRINVMTYFMAGPWDSWLSWHSSALSGNGARYPSSIAVSVDGYKKIGIPANKLGIGIGFFGICWKGVTGPRQEITSASIVASDNTMSIRNIAERYYTTTGYNWDADAQAPYLSYPNGYGPLGCNFISVDDERSAGLKGSYVRTNQLGGIIIWTVNQGYIPSLDKNPLLISLAAGVRGL